ncbi:dUTP diphosphatase [Mycoplasma zalophi]|uniref:dUTP diphosphatase n=1 Tax=Mycoplasma zalophi TaxID=191287 RepID=UPI0021CA44F9|nr:dUTP diphosphatase [Mycoplasma zalophi]MCU4116918.1 dUTP diphosphatase [Mycoplasma zalophi]
MNLQKVFDLQRDLDESFSKNISPNETNLQLKVIIALIVEISEFANEVQEFKYWKVHKNINQAALLEEYADGIHFLSSMCVAHNVDSNIEPIKLYDNFSQQLAEVYKAATILFTELNAKTLKHAYSLYLGLALTIGLTEDEILDSFYKKNEINFQRAKNKY